MANVRCPVSAIFKAASTVSRSRISPMSTMSGSSRSAARSASEKLFVSAVNFTLIDQAVLVRMDVLDRVLDRQNVVVTLGIDLVEHRGERRGLAAAGRAGDQHEAARALGQHGQHGRQSQLAERPDFSGMSR